MPSGTLYLVATPIGNYDDITLRALNILKSADIIICEEYKEARRLLSRYEIYPKELLSINEHNEKQDAQEIALSILQGQNAALISDCGTPLFSDPGHVLVDYCISMNISVVPVPGASSLLTALTGSGMDFEKFYHYGWLSPKKDERKKELLKLKTIHEVIILMDTPYRLKSLLADVELAFGKGTDVVLAYQLTMPGENFYRGKIKDVLKTANDKNLKGEFVLIVDNKKSRR